MHMNSQEDPILAPASPPLPTEAKMMTKVMKRERAVTKKRAKTALRRAMAALKRRKSQRAAYWDRVL